MKLSIVFSAACLVCLSLTGNAQMTLVPFVNNVTAVTDITHCGDDRVFIVEQAGKIRIADLQGNLLPAPFLSITARVLDGGERGLLGLAFSPDYTNDGRFYVNYTNNSGNSVISRFQVSAGNPDVADSLNEEILFTVAQPYSNHNGGAMFFGKDGYLYISLGDGGSAGDPGNRSQNLMEDLGKLLRIHVDVPSGYSIPGSNPYYGSVVANPKIWASGLRNAWRVSADRLNGDIWIADVGQNLWEEINHQLYSSTGGENYGWRCYEGNAAYNTAGCQPQNFYDAPAYVIAHGPACSVTGGYVYRGAEYSSWFGKYFFTDYCDGIIRSLDYNGPGNYVYQSYGTFQTASFSTMGEDRYGELYVGKVSTGVLKLTNAGCSPVAFIGTQDTVQACGSGYTFSTPPGQGFIYQWYLNGTAIAGASSNSYQATQNGNYHVQVVNTSFCFNYSDTLYLNLIPAPPVSFIGAPAITCINSGSVTLTGNPAGGMFSGAGITGNTFTPSFAGVGTHEITYTYDNGNGCVLTAAEKIVVDACVSLAETYSEPVVKIFPNPANDYIMFSWNVNHTGEYVIQLMDISGRVIITQIRDSEKQTDMMNLHNIKSGSYLLKVTGSKQVLNKNISVIK